jgi:cytochrome c553
MTVTQFLQYKVWYAGRSLNWRLADYEMKLLKDSFQDAVTFYPGLAQADMTIMDKSVAQVDAAAKGKDRAKSVRSFVKLTAACSSCHKSQGYGFIAVRLPTASLQRNQIFASE